ncbi:MAG: peptidase S8 [Candidatus Eremiobacteraeota bacterium]|nr:peptidase S8 [Candidatus Eremiobacteraeota bacterium]
MGNAGGGRSILKLIALLATVSLASCAGSSLEQTPLPVSSAQATMQAPQSAPGGAASEPSNDDSTDDAQAPISNPRERTAAPAEGSAAKPAVRYACAQPAAAGRRECDAILRPDAGASRASAPACNRTAPYCASDLQTAYDLTQAAKSGGKGATVAVVDAYGYPEAAGDLAVYRKNMGLPACGVSNGCLRIVNQSGRANGLPKFNADSNDDWRAEAALDLDMISATCPNCKIILVQTNSNKSSDLSIGNNAAAALGALTIVNSYGGKEENASAAGYRQSARAVIASAGAGPGSRGPCAYAAVVCVGGTSLLPTSSGRGWIERAWGNGGGCSALVTKPKWQHAKSCKTRAVVDISAVADPATGVAVYQSPAGWQEMGGTGIGTAIVAALFALGPASARANAPLWIWRHGPTSAYHHVAGSSGYDAATGWGTPNGTGGF